MPKSALRIPHSALPHRLAVLLVCATFPLVWVGGMVTSYNAGMAVPDWPTTYGYNMFLYPWQTWLFGPFDLFIEHGHRLLGALVGMISIAVVIVVWRWEPRPGVRALAAAILAAVIFQGVLGGLRVIGDEVELAKVHGIFATVFFGMTVALAVVTSRLWLQTPSPKIDSSAGKLHRLAIITTGLVLLQIIVGAHLRHLPANLEPATFRIVVFFHLVLAAALFVYVVMTASRVFMSYRGTPSLFRPALALSLLILLQIALGGGAWVVNYSWPAWAQGFSFASGHTVQAASYAQALTSTAHQAMGSLILGVCVMLTLHSLRLVYRGPILPKSASERSELQKNPPTTLPAVAAKLTGMTA